MKKLLMTIILVAATIFLFTGCSNKNDISACDEKRKEIEEKYGITICYGDDKVEAKELKGAKMLSEETRIETSLDEIDDFFSKLPDGFLDELEKYSGNPFLVVILREDLTGVIMKGVQKEHWAVDYSMITSSLAIDMMYSIYWHMEHATEDLGFLKDWYKYNPSDFEYGNSNEYMEYLYGNGNDFESYFFMREMMENVEDDITTLFMLLWKEQADVLQDTSVIPKMRAKIQYLCSEIDRVFETVDENAYWARYIK